MFGPHFSEGKILAESSSVALEAICFVLHMRSENISSEINADNLVRIAKHCDKYEVLVTTRPAIHLWLENYLKTHIDYGQATELLNIAFKLKLWAFFERFAVIMIQEAECDISVPDLHDDRNPQIPFYIFGT